MNTPTTFLSLLTIDDKRNKNPLKKSAVFSQCSNESKPASDTEIIDLLNMTDE